MPLYCVQWEQVRNVTSYCPGFRENGTMGVWEDKLVIYGGQGNQLIDQVEVMNLKNNEWEKKSVSSRPISARTNHCMAIA
jgi:hypothetical protein